MWFIFNLHREFLFYFSHTINYKRVRPFKERNNERKWFLVHEDKFSILSGICLKSTAFAPLALPSPLAPASRKRTLITYG
jgi:hypothetical protein